MKPKYGRRQSNLNFSTMGNRELGDYETESPGPGKYSPDDAPKKLRGVSFGHAERISPTTVTSPGPGSYNLGGADDVPLWHPLKHAFGKAKRPENISQNDNENGPGQYEISDSIFQKGFIPTRVNRSFSPQKGPIKKVIKPGPGPGSYYLPRELSKIGVTIPKSKKFSGFTEGDGMAGESYYRYNSHKDLGSLARAATIGNAKRTSLPKLDGIPGPSQYSPNIDAMKGKKVQGSFNREPRYNFKLLRNKSMEPGPGEYDNLEASTKYPVSFKGHHVDMLSNIQQSPGPGSYDHKDLFRMSEQDKYQAEELARRALLKRIAHNSSVMSLTHNPEHNSNDASTLTGGLSINKSQKSLIKSTARSTYMDQVLIPKSPGPIYYINQKDISTNIGKVGHKFEITRRHPEDRKLSPGPGVYNTDFHKKEVAEVRFAEAKRTDFITPPQAKFVPGAGAYSLKSDFDIIKPGGVIPRASRENEIKKRPKKLKQRSYIFEDMIKEDDEKKE